MKKLKLDIQMFGGSLSVTGTETNVSVENNQSYIDVVIRPSTNSTTFNETGNAYVQGTVVGQNNSYNIPKTYFKIGKSSTVTAYSGRIGPFNHNTDGSLDPVTINVQCYIVSNTQPSANVQVTMSTIPRASSITVNDANIGSSTNIVINKASENFTTTLRYRALKPDNTWTDWYDPIVTKSNFKEVYGWTVPTSLYSLIPNNQNIVCEFEATTFSGDTQIGSPTYARATFTATGNPVINNISVADTNTTTTALTGDDSKMVRYASNVKVIVTYTPQNGASVTSVKVNGSEVSYLQSPYGEITFNAASTNSFNVVVTDSRGYSTSQTITMNMVDYTPLTISANIERNTPVDGKVKISFNGNYFNDSFGHQSNSLTVQYRSRVKNGSWISWQPLSVTTSGNTYSNTSSEPISGYDYTNQYEFQIRATDKIQTKTIEGITVPKGKPVFNWRDEYFNVNGNYYQNDILLSNIYLQKTGGTISGNLNVTGNLQKNNTDVALVSDIPTNNNQLINGRGFVTFYTIWQNNSLTSFDAQTVTLNESINNFSYYEIIYKINDQQDIYLSSGKCPVGLNVSMVSQDGFKFVYRYITSMQGTTFSFNDCRQVNSYGSGTTVKNDSLIPYRIIGYK